MTFLRGPAYITTYEMLQIPRCVILIKRALKKTIASREQELAPKVILTQQRVAVKMCNKCRYDKLSRC